MGEEGLHKLFRAMSMASNVEGAVVVIKEGETERGDCPASFVKEEMGSDRDCPAIRKLR